MKLFLFFKLANASCISIIVVRHTVEYEISHCNLYYSSPPSTYSVISFKSNEFVFSPLNLSMKRCNIIEMSAKFTGALNTSCVNYCTVSELWISFTGWKLTMRVLFEVRRAIIIVKICENALNDDCLHYICLSNVYDLP